MYCNPDQQPEGEICNSNGIWPYYLSIEIGNVTITGSTISTIIEIELKRSCDPSCAYGAQLGIDKAFNHV